MRIIHRVNLLRLFSLPASLCVLLPCSLLFTAEGKAQISDPVSSTNDGESLILGHSFSAVKYSRLVRVMPGGKSIFLRNETYPITIARDSDGRIRFQDVDIRPPCDQLVLREPPPCLSWTVFVFDPTIAALTHWPEGEFAAHAAVVLNLTSEQVEEGMRSTSVLPADKSELADDSSGVIHENLGQKNIEGVLATGFRQTIRGFKIHLSKPVPFDTIHEVWVSKDMRLIVRVIDGNPHGIERISGLEHVSLSPDSSLFTKPEDYAVQRPETTGEYVIDDLNSLGSWYVEQDPATN